MPDAVHLRSSHLIIDRDLSGRLFAGSATVYVSYKAGQNAILVSAHSNTWFPKLHESKECLLKNKDTNGTKSVTVREFIIDHDLEDTDRRLPVEVHYDQRFLKVSI